VANARKNSQAQKRARKAAKRKASKQRTKAGSSGLGRIISCLTTGDLAEGMITIHLLRDAGQKARVSMFCVDTYCLGVKDVGSGMAYADEVLAKLHDRDASKIAAEDAKKLLLDAVAYAESLGFPPAAGYARAMTLFADMEASDRNFPMGSPEGKPLFIAGPDDGPERCDAIISQLRQVAGQGNFNFIMPHF
jgi:hypothetical protein